MLEPLVAGLKAKGFCFRTLREHPDYLGIAGAMNRIDLYQGGAGLAGVALPSHAMRASVLIDGVVWDGGDPAGYAESFAIAA